MSFVISVCGNAGSGKEIIGNIIESLLKEKGISTRREKFALPTLQLLCTIMNTIGHKTLLDNFELAEFKNQTLPHTDTTIQTLLQVIGEECKQVFDDNTIFAKRLVRAIAKNNSKVKEDATYITTDMRFIEEYNTLAKAKFSQFVIHVYEREEYCNTGVMAQKLTNKGSKGGNEYHKEGCTADSSDDHKEELFISKSDLSETESKHSLETSWKKIPASITIINDKSKGIGYLRSTVEGIVYPALMQKLIEFFIN